MLTVKGTELPAVVDNLFSNVDPDLRYKAESILKQIKSFGKVLVAFSGGVDSTLVAYLAKLILGANAIAVTADSPSLPRSELEETKQIAEQLGLSHIVIRTEELDNPQYSANPANRCYFCKKELSRKLESLAKELRVQVILDGTNADDLKGHRPGAAALRERGIRRPLADVGMTKAEVRKLARRLRLQNSDKPSMPCLSSRVQYGLAITPEKLLKIERSENLIRALAGVKELRVRDHGDLARIEVGKEERCLFFNEDLLDRIGDALRELGFTFVCFDLSGYRSGSMNEILVPETNP